MEMMSGKAAGHAAVLADETDERRAAAPSDSHGAANREAGGTRRRVSMACGSAFPLCRGPGSPGKDAFQDVSAAGLRRPPGRPRQLPGELLLGRSPGQVGRLTAGILEMYDRIRYLLFCAAARRPVPHRAHVGSPGRSLMGNPKTRRMPDADRLESSRGCGGANNSARPPSHRRDGPARTSRRRRRRSRRKPGFGGVGAHVIFFG